MVRVSIPDDFDQILALWEQFYYEILCYSGYAYVQSSLIKYIPKMDILVFDNIGINGFLAFSRYNSIYNDADTYAHVNAFYVGKDDRQKGIGEALLKALDGLNLNGITIAQPLYHSQDFMEKFYLKHSFKKLESVFMKGK